MSGKRLLDAIQLLNVAKSVAGKHLQVRQQQLDIYTRTSSLTKGIKSQVDGLVLTTQAAAALVRRFNGDHTPRTTLTSASPSSNSNAEANKQEAETHLDTDEPAPSNTPDNTAPLRQTIDHPRDTSEKKTAENAEDQGVSEDMMNQLLRSPRVARVLSKQGTSSIPQTSNWGSASTPGNIIETPIPPTEEPREIVAEGEVVDEVKKAGDVAPVVGRTRTLGKYSELWLMVTLLQADQKTSRNVTNDTNYQMMESRVPSSRLGRIWQYSGLATSMAFGAIGEGLRRVVGNADNNAGSIIFSEGNTERLVAKLSKMRGAALKLGQMLSFQGMRENFHHRASWKLTVRRFEDAS